MLLLNQAVLLLLVALAGRCAEARAVVREDVKGVAALLQDEARDDPFFDHNPQYDFAYRIHDEETGDAKDQTEERRGDAVQGSYSVVDPDGTLRVVRYTADDANGFNAVVSLTPGHAKPFVPKPTLQRRVAVVQNHVDVPVPVQHHVLPSTSQQILGDQRVLVEHPKHQASAQVQQHLIQPPLAFGLHQDVHHLIPRGPTYQLHHIHQLSPSGVGTHHQMTVPIVQIQDQGNMDAQQQHMAFLQVQQEQFKKQQEQVQAMIQAQQQGQLFLAPQPQKQAMNSAQQMEQQREGLQDAQPVQQQQQQQDQQSSILQDQQGSVTQQQTSISQEQGSVVQQDGVSQQQDIDSQQQENVIQQQDESSSGFSLPQVIDVRHSVVQKPEQGQALSPQSQVRSLDGGVLQSGRVSPHQRTLAVYRTSSGVQGGGNFITFSSPYAQYTVS
ncbi:putative mediator of RNA polymerase II transcription subunit 26 [Frankliniella occidentalis]|uniref:Mediator of RNA polymerase II transcription subunit 26 n=1 Tax=Frankliniella occidentalis TaxID=133901 RepID=A0A6J1S0H0_FRAOC|nr:putative mediator of RNA polymerase II transcription subunit 26 [Frankliniella occidentalis]